MKIFTRPNNSNRDSGIARLLLLLLLTAVATAGFSQAPGWQWARGGASDDNHANGVATDGSGNIYVAGSFSGSSITFGSTVISNAGGYDMYLVKYNGGGNVVWAQAFGGSDGDDEALGVAVDGSGNVFVTGYFQSTSIAFGATTLTNAASGAFDMFVVKLNSAGSVRWAKRAGGAGDDQGVAVAADKHGSVFVGAIFTSTSVVVGSTTLNNASSSATNDILIAKYDSTGNVSWAKRAGGTEEDYINSVAADGSGNLIVAGSFTSTSIAFGSFTCFNSTASFTDAFVAKYNTSGTALWANSGAGQSDDVAEAVIADTSGNYFVTGAFKSDTLTFNGTQLINAGAGLDDIFLLKYDNGGNLLWAQSAGTLDDEVAYSVATDVAGNCYLGGSFQGANLTFGSTTLTNSFPGKLDLFVAKYSKTGGVLWARSTGGQYSDAANSITTDISGNTYVAGYFESTSIVFGPSTLTNSGVSSNSFLARLAVSVGMENFVRENNQLKIYPNPVSQLITIEIPPEVAGGKIIISDLLGKEIISSAISVGKEMNLDVSSLSKGVYFLQLRTEENNYCEKIIKE